MYGGDNVDNTIVDHFNLLSSITVRYLYNYKIINAYAVVVAILLAAAPTNNARL